MRYFGFLFSIFALIFALTLQNSAEAALPSPQENARPENVTPLSVSKTWTIPQEKRSAYYPNAEAFEAMVDNLHVRGTDAGEGTHRVILTLTAGTPRTEGSVAYFFISPIAFEGIFMWMLEEYEEREGGLNVRFWFFSDEIRSYEADLFGGAPPSPSEYFMPENPGWDTAVKKSRLAWKLLCEKYGCIPHRYNAF
ncbi:MAG: hypothetical protein HYT93_02130 [Parcubacteria group bacterium]|nr:hypothetical protein [Parcubacteria group bacterium]